MRTKSLRETMLVLVVGIAAFAFMNWGRRVRIPPEYAEAGVTPEIYLEWRAPRFGRSNPEVMSNPFWAYMVRSRENAYLAAEALRGPDSEEAGPAWCFDRYGQTSTVLPDGRTVWIGGEHEDHYDPDFYIYNDVVVIQPDESVVVYGYPRKSFPPTDFHSATLVGDRIILVGSLGYPNSRKVGSTQVLQLHLKDFSMSRVETTGPAPGWIHSHRAELAEDGRSILVTRGELAVAAGEPLVENIDDWRLWIDDWRWERLTERNWPRWLLQRRDGEPNALFSMRNALWTAAAGIDMEQFSKDVISQMDLGGDKELEDEILESMNLKNLEDIDADLVSRLYRPEVPHTLLPEDEDEFGVYRIQIDGVTVRYVENTYSVRVVVEGELPSETIDSLKQDLLAKLQKIEKKEWVSADLEH